MNKELRDLLEAINNKKDEARTLVNNKQLDEAKALTGEIKDLQKEFDVKMALFEEEKENVIVPEAKDSKIDAVKAFVKALSGAPLTEAENALLTGGANGENLIIPQDIQTQINELRRQYKSARSLVGYYKTNTLTGSFVFEDTSTITGLTDFSDGADVPASNEPKFVNKQYSIKDKGALLPVSNKLIRNEAGGLIDYLGRWFNRKAIRTENADIFAALKSNKTAEALADWKALKKSINIDLDPALQVGMVIVTNQDGFDVLDSALDEQGRPVLQPNPTNPTQKLFMGYPVEVFSNAELPTVADKAPIFFGSLEDGVEFIDRDLMQFDTSEHAAFGKNQTVIRVIESYDVIQKDKDAYVFGELAVTPVV
jgi:HK97 family phage major capsid protein